MTHTGLNASCLVRFSLPGYQEPLGKEVEYGGYLKQMIIALNLSPAKVRDALRLRGKVCTGMWPSHGGKEKYVTVRGFVEELISNSGNSTLCFLKKFDYGDPNFNVEVGTSIGLFDSTTNQGSSFQMVTITEFNCKLWSHVPDEGSGFQLNDYL